MIDGRLSRYKKRKLANKYPQFYCSYDPFYVLSVYITIKCDNSSVKSEHKIDSPHSAQSESERFSIIWNGNNNM